MNEKKATNKLAKNCIKMNWFEIAGCCSMGLAHFTMRNDCAPRGESTDYCDGFIYNVDDDDWSGWLTGDMGSLGTL